MATNKNITMRQFNGSDYDTLYPRTTPSQVSGLYDSVYTKDQVNSLFNQCVLLDGSRAMTGNLNMDNHYIPNVLTGSSGGDAARKDYVDNLIASCAKIQTGSYVGTGTCGPSNPVTLTFSFNPQLLFISRGFILPTGGEYSSGSATAYGVKAFMIWIKETASIQLLKNYSEFNLYFNLQDTTLSWYNSETGEYYSSGAYDQYNASGQTYYYHCFG